MEKFKVSFVANNQQLTATGTKHASDTYADIEATFALGERWTDMDSVSAVWWNDFTRIATVLDSEGKCTVPHEVLMRKGCVRVNLVGSVVENGELVTRLTSYSAEAVHVNEKIKLTGSETTEITPSQFEQFVENVKADADRAESAKESAQDASASAQGYAQSASASASSASESATSAEQSATASARDAQTVSEIAVEVEVMKNEAELARDEILGMSAEAVTLPAGSEATASYADGLLSLGIPRGNTGATGAKGDRGDTGATPNLTIGTVETLEPTQDAYVTRRGTDDNPIFDFGIPKGDTGDVSQAQLDEAVTDLKSEISDIAEGIVTEDQVTFTKGTAILINTGAVSDLSGYDTWASCGLIPIPSNTSQIITNVNNAYSYSPQLGYAFYDKDLHFVVGGQFPPKGSEYASTIDILDTYKYIKMTNYNAEGDHSGRFITFYIGEIGKIKDETDALNSFIKIPCYGKPTQGKFITNNSDNEIVYYALNASKFMSWDVSRINGESVFVSTEQVSTTYRLVYEFVNANGIVVSSYLGSSSSAEILDEREIIVPDGATSMYVNCKASADMQIYTKSAKQLREFPASEIAGKSVVTYGDSLTWYDTQDYTWGAHQGEPCVGYQTYMRNVLGMVTTNRGRSGYTTPQFVAKLLEDNDLATFDYLTIMGGDNDDRLDVSVGTLQPIGGTFNASTVYGALQSAIEYALSENPSLRIVLMTEPIGCTYRTDEMVRVSSNIPTAYREVAELYGLPLIDLWSMSGVNELTFGAYYADPSDNHYYMYHPNNDGWSQISKIICNEFAEF